MRTNATKDATSQIDANLSQVKQYVDDALDTVHQEVQLLHSRDKSQSRAETMQLLTEEIQRLKTDGVTMAQRGTKRVRTVL